MDHQGSSTGATDLWISMGPGHGYILTSILLIIIASTINFVLRIIIAVYAPMNYELDMTTEKYCKPLAEIDNNLFHNIYQDKELFSNNSSEQLKITNCATDLLNNSRSMNVYNNNSSIGESCHRITKSDDRTYPNGWIPIMESFKVKPGSVTRAILFGKDLIITRSVGSEQVSVLDAYCPHAGVHIGVGGRVSEVDKQSCVECPFHGWTFRASDGKCVKIPYQKKCNIPEQAKLGVWTCAEVDNFIYIWHHQDNQAPSWFLAPSKELSLKDWQLAGRSCHKVNLELRDVLENGADMNHFEGIHNDLFVLGGDIIELNPIRYLQKYTRHHWEPEWRPILNEFGKMTHMAEMRLRSWITLFNLKLFDITVRAVQIGPARVNLYYNSKWYGKGLLTMNAIPLGGRRTKYIQHIYTQKTMFQCFMAKWVLYGEIKMLERDFFIWNHKKDLKNPVFVQEDKVLKQFRLWYSRFYKRERKIVIQNSKSLNSVDENSVKSRNTILDF